MEGRPFRLAFAALVCATLALAIAPAALAREDARRADPVITWLPPTPDEGAQLAAVRGSAVTIELAAAASDPTAVVRIAAEELPDGAMLDSTPGNPATATFSWTPTKPGDYELAFVASVDGTDVVSRRSVVVHVTLPATFQLSGIDNVSRWAFVSRTTTARAQPSFSARAVARLGLRTPEGSDNLVLALNGVRLDDGQVWIRVRLPMLPNNSTGWLPREALGGFHVVHTRLLVERRRFRITLFDRGRAVFRARIGVGLPQWPTPRGQFYIRVRLIVVGDPFYGPLAFGTSARSAVLTDWPGGGFVGIHGTSVPEILPGRVSHGCVRMRNPDIVRLGRLLPVGTPLTIT